MGAVGRPQWAAAARRMLDEMPAERDRQLLVRFYLNDEGKRADLPELDLSQEHFNRVIFRARHRFRDLLNIAVSESRSAYVDRDWPDVE